MISTALALQEATKNAVEDETIMTMASGLFHLRGTMSDDEFAKALFHYTAGLAALTTTLVTNVLLTDQEINDMMNTIEEFETIGKDIE